MKNLDNLYLKNITKNEESISCRYNNTSKYSNLNSSKHRECYASSEDEKIKPKINDYVQYNINNKIYKYQKNPLLNTSFYIINYSKKLLNDNDNYIERKTYNKSNIQDNSFGLSNDYNINSSTKGNRPNNISQKFNRNPLKYENLKTNYNYNESLKTTKYNNILDYNNNYKLKDIKDNNKIFNYKNSNKNNEKHILNISNKIIEDDSISKSFQGKNTSINLEHQIKYDLKKNNIINPQKLEFTNINYKNK